VHCYFLIIPREAEDAGLGAAGEIANVSQAFQPSETCGAKGHVCFTPDPSTGIPTLHRICGWRATRYQIPPSQEDTGIVRLLQSDRIKRARREDHTLGAINEGVRKRSLLVFY
jgi:hypothetical protein